MPTKKRTDKVSPPHWPSLESQLAVAKVTPGSALEKLIKENQDFHLLEPEEADDDAGLPAWLRVHWRKNHPDLPHPKNNPGAGYPDVLHTIHHWMLLHHDLPWGSSGGPSRAKGGKS